MRDREEADTRRRPGLEVKRIEYRELVGNPRPGDLSRIRFGHPLDSPGQDGYTSVPQRHAQWCESCHGGTTRGETAGSDVVGQKSGNF